MKVRRQARDPAPDPLPLPVRAIRRLQWLAAAWCGGCAALGLYMAAGGMGWLTGLVQAFGLAVGAILFVPSLLISRLTGRRRRLAQAAGVLWGLGLVATLYAVVSGLSAVGVLVALLVILFLFGGRR